MKEQLSGYFLELREALESLINALLDMRSELVGNSQIENRDKYIEMWDSFLIPLMQDWLNTVKKAIQNKQLQATEELQDLVADMLGLGKDFDADLSWSTYEKIVKANQNKVVLAAIKIHNYLQENDK